MRAPKPFILSQDAEQIGLHDGVASVCILNTICPMSDIGKLVRAVASPPSFVRRVVGAQNSARLSDLHNGRLSA